MEAFSGCSSLKEVKLPAGLSEISAYLFRECSELETVTVPDSVTSIENSAFLRCPKLKTIEIPAGVTYIGSSTFSGCKSFTELNLPEVGVAPQDDDGRRRELYRVWGSKGGCNINYYRKLIALLGIDATIFEYTKNPERFVGYVFPENAIPQYYLMIRFKIHQQEFSYFTAGVSGAGDRVMDFTDNFLESIFEKSRQAHIKIAYSYLTEEYVNLVTNDGKKFVTSDGKKLIGFQFME